jgi:hypothetical protein
MYVVRQKDLNALKGTVTTMLIVVTVTKIYNFL